MAYINYGVLGIGKVTRVRERSSGPGLAFAAIGLRRPADGSATRHLSENVRECQNDYGENHVLSSLPKVKLARWPMYYGAHCRGRLLEERTEVPGVQLSGRGATAWHYELPLQVQVVTSFAYLC